MTSKHFAISQDGDRKYQSNIYVQWRQHCRHHYHHYINKCILYMSTIYIYVYYIFGPVLFLTFWTHFAFSSDRLLFTTKVGSIQSCTTDTRNRGRLPKSKMNWSDLFLFLKPSFRIFKLFALFWFFIVLFLDFLATSKMLEHCHRIAISLNRFSRVGSSESYLANRIGHEFHGFVWREAIPKSTGSQFP